MPATARAVACWLDAAQTSLVAALALALVIPSVNLTLFDGLPLAGVWEACAFAALLPFVFSSSLRAALAARLGKWTSWGRRLVLIAVVAAIVLKALLLAFGSDGGFVGCYASTWKPPSEPCERSYSNFFGRNGDATRIDEQIDFGPTDSHAADLLTSPDSMTLAFAAYSEGVAATDWDLSFSNDLRFNDASEYGSQIHELLPFSATWRGTAQVPDDGVLQIRYSGRGRVSVGAKQVLLPRADQSRRIVVRVPAGAQPMRARFAFADARFVSGLRGVEFPELRLLDSDGDAIEAATPSGGEQIAATAVWLTLAVIFAGLAIVALTELGSDLLLLALIAIAAVLVTLISSKGQFDGFQYLAALLAPILVWRAPRRPILFAYGALLLILGADVLNSAPDIHAVLYRTSGVDFLTYESFARDIVLGHSLEGGESVFFYQPGSRYVLALAHLLFGDGDVLIVIWSMVALCLPFAALISWQRKRARSPLTLVAIAISGFLLLAVLCSPTILSLVALGASEVPSWALLPLAVAAPQLYPGHTGPWVGSAAAGALIWVIRNNQALAAATILVSIGVAIGRHRRRLLAALSVAFGIVLLPAIHNVLYGQDFSLTATSMGHDQQIDLTDLPEVFTGSGLGGQIQGHIGAILYDPPTPGLTTSSLGILLWGLLAAWIGAIVLALWRLRRREAPLLQWILLCLPIAYLAPHVIYQVEIYYPRHIIAGYLAMGVSAIGAFAEMGRTAEKSNGDG